jgi:hypothetical protein
MTVTYSATLKTNRMQLVADLIAGKAAAASTGSATAGQLVIGTASLSGAGVALGAGLAWLQRPADRRHGAPRREKR